MRTEFNIKVLVAPLDWGLGHACRCIPIIHHLISLGCTVILAADGPQQKLLAEEFPSLTILRLPGYNIKYAKSKRWFTVKIISQLPKILRAIKDEHDWLKTVIKEHKIDAIISDNRYGLHDEKLPSAFITHQLNIETPSTVTTRLVQHFHYKLINKFSACWVPDFQHEPSIAGRLSHPKHNPRIPTKYIGGLSRFEVKNSTHEYLSLIIISGPEPQRTILEKKILKDISNFSARILFVRGLPGEAMELPPINNTKFVNHLSSGELAEAFSKSEFIISRTGYTTVMDILKLGKKSILIPTPGQTEQEYLARHLLKQQWSFTINQDTFQLEDALKKAAEF